MASLSSSAQDAAAAAAALPGASEAGEPGSADPALSYREFRSALGRFATGVTVVTALDLDGKPIGLTVSSFNSVSLAPPLILWSLSLVSPHFEALRKAHRYAINVLSAEQQPFSDRFATRNDDHFADLPQHVGLGRVPLIDGCCAWFECVGEAQYPGGDHIIFVGRVERYATGATELPLIFHNGRYRALDPR
jgi:flavin reductase (DIM6/NTAB) family NADH-FMN oxidoreductase RutF